MARNPSSRGSVSLFGRSSRFARTSGPSVWHHSAAEQHYSSSDINAFYSHLAHLRTSHARLSPGRRSQRAAVGTRSSVRRGGDFGHRRRTRRGRAPSSRRIISNCSWIAWSSNRTLANSSRKWARSGRVFWKGITERIECAFSCRSGLRFRSTRTRSLARSYSSGSPKYRSSSWRSMAQNQTGATATRPLFGNVRHGVRLRGFGLALCRGPSAGPRRTPRGAGRSEGNSRSRRVPRPARMSARTGCTGRRRGKRRREGGYILPLLSGRGRLERQLAHEPVSRARDAGDILHRGRSAGLRQ